MSEYQCEHRKNHITICDPNNNIPYVSNNVNADPGEESIVDKNNTTTSGNKELAWIIMGDHFTTSSGDEVNKTYEAWIANLNTLVENRLISRFVANSFIMLNYFNRQRTIIEDETSTHYCDLPKYFHPPYVI